VDSEFNREIFLAAAALGYDAIGDELFNTGVSAEAWFFLDTMNEDERNDYIFGR